MGAGVEEREMVCVECRSAMNKMTLPGIQMYGFT